MDIITMGLPIIIGVYYEKIAFNIIKIAIYDVILGIF